MQEGHRFDFVENDKSKDQIVLKGIVYNEMKGAMSSISSQADQGLNKIYFQIILMVTIVEVTLKIFLSLLIKIFLNFIKNIIILQMQSFFTYGKIDITSLQK